MQRENDTIRWQANQIREQMIGFEPERPAEGATWPPKTVTQQDTHMVYSQTCSSPAVDFGHASAVT